MPTFGSTLKELSNQYAKKQPKQVNTLLEKAPVLDIIPFMEASHGLWNVYEEMSNITGAAFVDMDSVLPDVGADSDLKKVDLSIMGGQIFVPEDRAELMGGREKYFAKKMPSILKYSGMSAEQAIIYNNLRQFAIDNGMKTLVGGSGNANYSILFVRFESEVCTGLYSPQGFKQGAMLDTRYINGGNLYANAAGVLGYGMRLKGYFGMQLADSRCCGVLANCTSSNRPTGMQMDDMLARIRADESGNTFIICHPRMKAILNELKGGNIQSRYDDKRIDRSFDYWGSVRILTTYNMYDGTEANVA